MATDPEKIALSLSGSSSHQTVEEIIKYALLTEPADIVAPHFKKKSFSSALQSIMWDIVEIYLSHHEEDVEDFIPPYQLNSTLQTLKGEAKKNYSIIKVVLLEYGLNQGNSGSDLDRQIEKRLEVYLEHYQAKEIYRATLLEKIRTELTSPPRLILPNLLRTRSVQHFDRDLVVRLIASCIRAGRDDGQIITLLEENKISHEPSWIDEARLQVTGQHTPIHHRLIMPILQPPPYSPEDPLRSSHGGASSSAAFPIAKELVDGLLDHSASLEASLEERRRQDLLVSTYPAGTSHRFFSSLLTSSPPLTPSTAIPPSSNHIEGFVRFILTNETYHNFFVRPDIWEPEVEFQQRIRTLVTAHLNLQPLPRNTTADEREALELAKKSWQSELSNIISDTLTAIRANDEWFYTLQRRHLNGQTENDDETEARILSLLRTYVKNIPLPTNIIPTPQEIQIILSAIQQVRERLYASRSQSFASSSNDL